MARFFLCVCIPLNKHPHISSPVLDGISPDGQEIDLAHIDMTLTGSGMGLKPNKCSPVAHSYELQLLDLG